MGEAYGKLTGRPGICLVTRGPGATQAAVGVHTAKQDSSPMLLLVGQVPRAFSGREAWQELDYAEVFGGIAKAAWELDSAERIPEHMAEAFAIAVSGRPGPVVLALVDADHDVQPALAAHVGEAVDERPRHVDAVLPEPLPELVPAVEGRRAARPRVRRVEGDERLRQDRELGAAVRGLVEQGDRLLDGRLGIEDHRRRLDRGDAYGPELHAREPSATVAA